MEKGAGGCGCDGRSTSSDPGEVSIEGNAQVEMKGNACDDIKRTGKGEEQAPSPQNASSAPASGTSRATLTRVSATTTTTCARLGEETNVDAEDEKSTDAVWVDNTDGGDKGQAAKDGEAGQVDAGQVDVRSGGGSNRAQRTCRRLALKRIRQYVGYFEEDASTPTAADGRPHDERTLFKEGKSRTATPSTGTTSLRSSSSSRTRKSGPGIAETPSIGGIRQRGRIIASPDHILTLPKQVNRTRGEREPDDDVKAPTVCNSPVGGTNRNEEAFPSGADSGSNNEGCIAAAPGTSDEISSERGCPVNGADLALDVNALAAADTSGASTARCASSSAHSHSGCNSTGSDRCRAWTDEDGDAAVATRTDEPVVEGGADMTTPEIGIADRALRSHEGDGAAENGAAEIAGCGSPEMSSLEAETARRSLAGCADGVPGRLSGTLLRSGTATDPELQERQRWQRQQHLLQQHGSEAGNAVLCFSDDIADTDDRVLTSAEKLTKCENDGLLFCSASASANAVVPSPAAATFPPPAVATLSSNMVLSASTLPALRAACGFSAASVPTTLASPTAGAQQHAANLNALMVKSVSPAGVVRRGGRNRRKRTKYDLAYRQMEQLGPFAEEAKTVDLSKVSGSSFAVELLKNPEHYTYEAWSQGFAWPVGADGRRLLLRKLRGVYWSDPEYWQQRLMSEGLYRRDLFTLATVQERLLEDISRRACGGASKLFSVTQLANQRPHERQLGTQRGEEGGGPAAHGSSPEALSPHAGPRPVTPNAAEATTCPRKIAISSRSTLLQNFASDQQMFVGRERGSGTKSLCADTTGAETCGAHPDTAAAVRAFAAAAGAAVEDPVSFSSWLRATTAGVTSVGDNDSMSRSAADAGGMTPEEMLLFSHAGAVAGEIEQNASTNDRRTYNSSSQMKKPSSRRAVSHTATCEPDNSGLQLDLSTQQVLDAVAAAVEAAAVERSSQKNSSQTTLVNRNSSVSAEREPYLAASSDIAAVLAAARDFHTAYECPSSSSSSTSQIACFSSSKGSDALHAADSQPAAAGGNLTVPCLGSNTGGGPPYDRAAAVAFGESEEDSAAGAHQQLSAAAAAAAAADWLGSLQQLLPPVLHDSAQCEGARVQENTMDTSLHDGKAAEATPAGRRSEFSCPPRYTSLSVFDSAGEVTVPSTSGAHMADKLLELLAPPAGDKCSSTEVCARRAECSNGKALAENSEDAHTPVSAGTVEAASSFVREGATKEADKSGAGTDGHQQGFKQHYASEENREKVHDEKREKEDDFVIAKKPQPRRRGSGGSPPWGCPRAEMSTGAGKLDTNKSSPSAPALDLLLSIGDDHLAERDASDRSCSTCLVTVPDRTRHSSSNSSNSGTDSAVETVIGERRRECTVADEKSSFPSQAVIRNMMRLMTAAAAAATTAPDMSGATGATATEEGSAATGVSSRLVTEKKCRPDGVKDTSSRNSHGEAIMGKTGSDKELYSLELLQSQQQQDQQSCTMNNLILTLATVLQQHMAPQSTESVNTGKYTEGSDTISEENAQRLLSLLQMLNQHLERQQKKPVTTSSAPSARAGSLPGLFTMPVSGLAHTLTSRGRSSHQLESRLAREDAQGPMVSDRVEEPDVQPCHDGVGSNSCEQFSSRRRCGGCGARCSEGKRLCSNCSRRCTRGTDKPFTRRDSDSAPAPPVDASSFAVGPEEVADLNDLCASTHILGEEPLSEKSMQETASALPGDTIGGSKGRATQGNKFPKGRQDTHLQHGGVGGDDGVQTGGGADGSFSGRQQDALRSSSVPQSRRTGQSQTDTTHNNHNVEKQAEGAAAPISTGGVGELQLSTDLWLRCMQAMGSSLTYMRKRLPRTTESHRCFGGAYNSDSGASNDVAGTGAAAGAHRLPARAAAQDGNASSKSSGLFSGMPPEGEEKDGLQRRVPNSCKESQPPSQSFRHRCSPRERTVGAESDVNLVALPGAGGESSGALFLHALRAYASSAVSTGTTPRCEISEYASGKLVSSNATKESSLVGNTSSYRIPRSTESSCWNVPLVHCRDGDTSTSSGGPACSGGASAPLSAASLLESTHALLQLKTHYDFMAQFMQCMMLLEVQQALVGLLQSLRRKSPGTSRSNSRNPSGSSSTVRRTRRVQRRGHQGKKRKISFFSSGNEISNDSSSEPALTTRSLRSSERLAQSRRRRRRIDAAVHHVPAEPFPRIQGGEEALKQVSPLLSHSSSASQGADSSVVEHGLPPQERQLPAPEMHSDAAEAPLEIELNATGAQDAESNNKEGCSGNSIQASSTCSSSSAYSSVGRCRYRQSNDVQPCRNGKDHDNSDVDASGSFGTHDGWASPKGEKGTSKDRTNSTNSSRSRSVSCPKADGGEDSLTDTDRGARKRAAYIDSLNEEEGGQRRSCLREGSNKTPPTRGDLQADHAIRVETFSDRDTTIQSCLQSLVESLKVQVKFVHAMAGHLQEHVSAAAAQEDKLEDHSVFRRMSQARHADLIEKTGEDVNAFSAAGRATNSADVSGRTTSRCPGESLALNAAAGRSPAADKAGDGEQKPLPDEGSSAPKLCEGDAGDKNGEYGGQGTVRLSLSPYEDMQQNLEQNRSEFREKHSRRNSGAESHSGPGSWKENVSCGDTDVLSESQCTSEEKFTSTEQIVDSDRDDTTVQCVGSKKKRCREASASEGMISEKGEQAGDAQPPPEIHAQEEAHKEVRSFVGAPTFQNETALTRKTREGEKPPSDLLEEACLPVSGGIAVSPGGDSGCVEQADRSAPHVAAEEDTIAALAVAERSTVEEVMCQTGNAIDSSTGEAKHPQE